jgi:hypothetical protein
MGIEQSFGEILKIVNQYWYLFVGAIILALIVGKTLGKKKPIDLNQFVKNFEKHEIKSEKINKGIPKQIYHGNHFLGILKSYSEVDVDESSVNKALRETKDFKNLPEQERIKLSQDFKKFKEVKVTVAQRVLFKSIPIPFFSDDMILRLNKEDISYYEKKIVIPEKLRIAYTIGNEYIVLSNNTSEQISRVHDDMMTLLTNYSFTVQTKNMEKLAGNEPNFAQIREMMDRETRKEAEKKKLKSESY